MRTLFFSALFIFLFASQAYGSDNGEARLPKYVRVGLAGEFSGVGRVEIGNQYLSAGFNIDGEFSPLETVYSETGFTLSAESGTEIVLYAGNNAALTLNDVEHPVQIRDGEGGYISLNGMEYMNTVEFLRDSSQTVTAVNVLTPQEYLYSVVPTEMPPTFHHEALKAQSLAARNYLLTLLNRHGDDGYDMCDQGHCLIYKGAERNDPASTAAVDETYGEMIYYEGTPINAVFFSSSGGVTDDSENVWAEALPYLRGVTDPNEAEPMVWTRTFTWDELTDLLTEHGASVGRAVNVEISAAGAGGRVSELIIYGENGRETLTKEDIRTFFSPSRDGTLESRNFTLEGGTAAAMAENETYAVTDGEAYAYEPAENMYVLLPDGQAVHMDGQAVRLDEPPAIHNLPVKTAASGGEGVTLTGSGWGHGVGMSQRGAEGLARLGYGYREILKHYYSGVEIY